MDDEQTSAQNRRDRNSPLRVTHETRASECILSADERSQVVSAQRRHIFDEGGHERLDSVDGSVHATYLRRIVGSDRWRWLCLAFGLSGSRP